MEDIRPPEVPICYCAPIRQTESLAYPEVPRGSCIRPEYRVASDCLVNVMDVTGVHSVRLTVTKVSS